MTDLLSVQEVASLAATSCEWVRREIKRGKLPAVRIGARSWVIRRADAETWLGRKEGGDDHA